MAFLLAKSQAIFGVNKHMQAAAHKTMRYLVLSMCEGEKGQPCLDKSSWPDMPSASQVNLPTAAG
jgi:hypothetical protein